MSDGMGREFTYLSSHATNRYIIPNWGIKLVYCFALIEYRTVWRHLYPGHLFQHILQIMVVFALKGRHVVFYCVANLLHRFQPDGDFRQFRRTAYSVSFILGFSGDYAE